MPGRAWKQAVILVAFAASLLIAACGSSDSSSTSGGSSSSGSKEIIGFVRTSSDTYQAAWQRGFKDAAKKAGYTVTFIENNADQNEQNSQVQQQIGANKKPAAWVWMPADADAGAASLKALHDTGLPVFQVNQLPAKNTESFVTAYAGVNDVLNGRTSGELMVQARDALKSSGAKLHSPGGNLAIIKFYPGFAATTSRLQGFNEATKDAGFTVVGEAENAVDAPTGQKAMASLIPALKTKGVDLVYAQNDASASGAIQALRAAGYSPGKDVMVVGGNCRDDVSDLESGRQFGTGLQSAEFEGLFSMDVIGNYLKNPKVKDGEYTAPSTPDKQPPMPDEISKFNYLPNPAVTGDKVKSTKLWGRSMVDLCSY